MKGVPTAGVSTMAEAEALHVVGATAEEADERPRRATDGTPRIAEHEALCVPSYKMGSVSAGGLGDRTMSDLNHGTGSTCLINGPTAPLCGKSCGLGVEPKVGLGGGSRGEDAWTAVGIENQLAALDDGTSGGRGIGLSGRHFGPIFTASLSTDHVTSVEDLATVDSPSLLERPKTKSRIELTSTHFRTQFAERWFTEDLMNSIVELFNHRTSLSRPLLLGAALLMDAQPTESHVTNMPRTFMFNIFLSSRLWAPQGV